MPLVPTNTYERWYRKDSWVYRQFAYLFANPLWTKKVPTGFSLCPYFWLALFSATFFRLFVGLLLGAGALIKLLHLKRAVAKLDKLAGPILESLFRQRTAGCYAGATFVLSLVIFGGSFILYLASKGVIALWANTGSAIALDGAEIESFRALVMLPLTILAAWASAGFYILSMSDKPRRCYIESYVVVFAILAFASALWLHTEYAKTVFIQVPLEILAAIWGGVAWFATSAWHWIVDILGIVGTFLLGVPTFLWELLKAYAIACFSLLALAVFGWIYTRVDNAIPVALPSAEAIAAEQARKVREARMIVVAMVITQYDYAAYHEFRGEEFWRKFIWRFESTICKADSAMDAYKIGESLHNEAIQVALSEYGTKWDKKRRREIRCQAISDGFASVLKPVGRNIWRGVRAIGILIGAVFVGIWAVLTYLWALVKAKKKGACPFLRFEDV